MYTDFTALQQQLAKEIKMFELPDYNEDFYFVVGEEDDLGYEDCEYHRTEMVEKFVTHANARDFEDLYSWRVDGDPVQWLADLIGFPEGHWAFQFVADELEALANDYYPSDDEIEAAAERSAKAVYALYN